jgi:RNA polymerase sigma-70 factor (ECF subfamily)
MSEDSSFHDLIRRVRAGDQQAAAELIRCYEPAIRLVVRHRLRDASLRRLLDSTDICQSILLNFFVQVALGNFELDTPEDLRRLLTTMALNNIRNHARRLGAARRGPGRVREGGAAGEEVADPCPSPSHIVANRELLEEVRRRLSEEERLLVDLRFQACSWAEIAARVGGQADAVRMRFTRALARVLGELGLSG